MLRSWLPRSLTACAGSGPAGRYPLENSWPCMCSPPGSLLGCPTPPIRSRSAGWSGPASWSSSPQTGHLGGLKHGLSAGPEGTAEAGDGCKRPRPTKDDRLEEVRAQVAGRTHGQTTRGAARDRQLLGGRVPQACIHYPHTGKVGMRHSVHRICTSMSSTSGVSKARADSHAYPKGARRRQPGR